MRPKECGQSCAGDRPGPGPGDPAAVTPALPPAAGPAPEPSAEPGPAPAQAPAAEQGVGSGSPSVSGPSDGVRPASEAGSEAGAQRGSAFSAVQGNAQSVPGNSDVPWTRFIFQGPFGPRATGLGTGKAADIWKTPAAYIGRRPGVSGPERAAFIRELEEGKPGPRDPGAGRTRTAPGKRGPRLVQAHCPLLTLSPTLPPTLAMSLSAVPVRSPLPRLLLPFSRSLISVGGPGPGACALPLPALRACCCGRSERSPGPLLSLPQCQEGGGGLREGAAQRALSLRWPAAPAVGRWVGGGRVANL